MPLPALDGAPDYRDRRTHERFWSGKLSEVKRTAGCREETRFYCSGFAQGVILDRVTPDWEVGVFDERAWVEDLVAEAVRQR